MGLLAIDGHHPSLGRARKATPCLDRLRRKRGSLPLLRRGLPHRRQWTAGTPNYVAIISTVNCFASTSRFIAADGIGDQNATLGAATEKMPSGPCWVGFSNSILEWSRPVPFV